MNEKILNDTIKQTKTSVIVQKDCGTEESISIWFWVSVIELLVILFLLLLRKRKKTAINDKRQQFKKEAMNEKVDFNNIINSSFQAQEMYNNLKKKCHPDRFPTDSDKNKIALELFQEITKNKTNYKKLLELQEEAKTKLNIVM